MIRCRGSGTSFFGTGSDGRRHDLSTVLTLAVIPAIYALGKQWRLKRGMEG